MINFLEVGELTSAKWWQLRESKENKERLNAFYALNFFPGAGISCCCFY